MTAYTTEGWGELFLCAGGATAALSGLIFVGLSVNIRTVLDLDKREGQNFLTGRAIEALAALLLVLVISVVALTPAIHRGVLAAFILLTAAGSAVSPSRALQASRALRASRGRALGGATILRLVTAIALTLTLAAAGVTLAADHGGGLYWLPAAFVLAITVAAVSAWVLLVEVLR
jgi:modulator of FtsH protease